MDSGIVKLTMAYNPIIVMSSFSKPLHFKGIHHKLKASGNIEA